MNMIAHIEDNADNRLLVEAMLDGLYTVQDYENGAQALAGMVENPPDLVLLDISLPGMDGSEVLEHMRQHERLRSIPVIAVTAHAMAGDREAYLERGFDDYLTKPMVDEDALLGAIRRLMP